MYVTAVLEHGYSLSLFPLHSCFPISGTGGASKLHLGLLGQLASSWIRLESDTDKEVRGQERKKSGYVFPPPLVFCHFPPGSD